MIIDVYTQYIYFILAPELIHGQIYVNPYLIIICWFSRSVLCAEVYHHGVCVSGRAWAWTAAGREKSNTPQS